MLSFPAALRQVVQSVRNNAKLWNNAPAQCFENQVLASLLSAIWLVRDYADSIKHRWAATANYRAGTRLATRLNSA